MGGVVVNQFIHKCLQNLRICAQSCSWLQIREYWEGLLNFFHTFTHLQMVVQMVIGLSQRIVTELHGTSVPFRVFPLQ